MKRKLLTFYLVIIIFFVYNVTAYGISKDEIPKMIKVGIKYKEDSQSLVNLSSNTGFDIGYYSDGEFEIIVDAIDKNNLIIKKDLNDTTGPFHIEVDKEFQSKEEVENFLIESQSYSTYFYPVYDKGWKVWTGVYNTELEAQNFIENLENISDNNLKVVKPNDKRVQVIDEDGKVLLIYDSQSRDIHFRPFLDKDNILLICSSPLTSIISNIYMPYI